MAWCRQAQAITSANVDADLCRHMASLWVCEDIGAGWGASDSKLKLENALYDTCIGVRWYEFEAFDIVIITTRDGAFNGWMDYDGSVFEVICGPSQFIKMPSYQYRDCHVKDKTVSPTVLYLTWGSPYLGKTVFILRRGPDYFTTTSFRVVKHIKPSILIVSSFPFPDKYFPPIYSWRWRSVWGASAAWNHINQFNAFRDLRNSGDDGGGGGGGGGGKDSDEYHDGDVSIMLPWSFCTCTLQLFKK